MDIKELSKQIIGLILPLVKLDAVNEIGNDFKDAANGSLRELWIKVKPLFIEEYEELKKHPDDSDAQAAARNKLKRVIEDKEELHKELNTLLEKIKKDAPDSFSNLGKIEVKDSQSVMIGGTISAGGNVHFGNKKARKSK